MIIFKGRVALWFRVSLRCQTGWENILLAVAASCVASWWGDHQACVPQSPHLLNETNNMAPLSQGRHKD